MARTISEREVSVGVVVGGEGGGGGGGDGDASRNTFKKIVPFISFAKIVRSQKNF